MCKFESEVLLGLQKCGITLNNNSEISIGVAVSGGADSVSLLLSLSNILSEVGLPLYVISVNHNIRSPEESGGDALFVQNLCESLIKEGKNIVYKIVELEPGLVNKVSVERKQGIEDAARYLRYNAFEDFIKEYNLSYLCLAHNQNDQLETLLMRFLQGSGSDSEGIAGIRGKFVRPLLEIDRNAIENYLIERKISWRTDSTNYDTNYLRNRVRQKLIPLLDNEFNGWKKAVLTGRKKAELANEVIEELETKVSLQEKNGAVVIQTDELLMVSDAVKINILMKAMNLAGESRRIPFAFVEDILKSFKTTENRFIKCFDQVQIEVKKNILFIKKWQKNHTDLSFFDIIEENGNFLFPFGEIEVSYIEQNRFAKVLYNNQQIMDRIELPFIIRNMQIDDELKCSNGTMKKLADIFQDWHVEEDHRKLIPVIQLPCVFGQPVIAVLGSILGYKDWIVK